MSDSTLVADQLWEWIQPPLEELKERYQQHPETPWDTWRGEFLERLGLSAPEDHPLSAELIAHLDQLSSEEERREFLTNGMAEELIRRSVEAMHNEQPHAGTETADGAAYDESAWQAFLVQYGPSWDGSAESWPQFSEWFRYHAGEQGLAYPAGAFLDHVEAQPDKAAVFAAYGVVIGTPAPEAGADVDGQVIEQIALPALAQALENAPEIAELGEERLQELLSEVLVEELEQAQQGNG